MKNRRRGPDFIVKMIQWITAIAWAMLCGIFFIIVFGNPAARGMTLTREAAQGAPPVWLSPLVYVLFVFLIILSISGIIFNMARLKRKTDRMKLTFFFSGIFAIIGLIVMSMS